MRVARQALPLYAPTDSSKVYTQPQLFAGLVLKTFFTTDYRGLSAQVQDHSDLRTLLGLKTVPHFTTLPKVSKRWLRFRVARRLFPTTVRRFRKRRRRLRRAAWDSTG